MLTLQNVFFAFVWIALLILAGRLIKQHVKWIRRLYLPESIVAGALALILGPQVLGMIATSIGGEGAFLSQGLFSEAIRETWSQAPGIFINIVFAALFLGEVIPSPKQIWRKAAPQVVFGQSLAWGQYVVGILVTLLILIPLFDANPISAALIEIGFEGGHGTAGGMAGTLTDLDFPEGADLALGLATVGIISGIVTGTFLADWARKRQHISVSQGETSQPDDLPELSHTDTEAKRSCRYCSRLWLDHSARTRIARSPHLVTNRLCRNGVRASISHGPNRRHFSTAHYGALKSRCAHHPPTDQKHCGHGARCCCSCGLSVYLFAGDWR